MEAVGDVDGNDVKIVIVVADGEEVIWQNDSQAMCASMKQEPRDEHEIMEIIEAAEKHGEPIKLEYLLKEGYYDENKFSDVTLEQTMLNVKKANDEYFQEEDAEENYGGDDNSAPSDVEEDSDEYSDDSDSKKKYNHKRRSVEKRQHNKHTIIPAAQRKSFIEDLKQQYPELVENEKALIKTVAEIMRNCKPPPPPAEYFLMNGALFECIMCGVLSNCISAASRHFQDKHGSRYLVCFACGVDFRSKTNLCKHEKRCIAPDAVVVLKARALSLGRKGRSRPFLPDLRTVPQLKPKASKRFTCSQCSASFTNKVYLVAHEHMHRGERPYWCDKCPSGYTSLSALTRHKKKHSDEVYICDHCSRPFKIKAALVVHMDTHNPVPKFGCPHSDCDKRFASKNALNHHVRRVHLRLPMPCACQICPRRYPRMYLLRDHMKKQHGMALMTRKMFFKAVPTLTQEQLEQAKVIMKGDGPVVNLSTDLQVARESR